MSSDIKKGPVTLLEMEKDFARAICMASNNPEKAHAIFAAYINFPQNAPDEMVAEMAQAARSFDAIVGSSFYKDIRMIALQGLMSMLVNDATKRAETFLEDHHETVN